MEGVKAVNVPLRTGAKKMKKRRELDALVAHSMKRPVQQPPGVGGLGSLGISGGGAGLGHDQLLTESSGDDSWTTVGVGLVAGVGKRARVRRTHLGSHLGSHLARRRKACGSLLRVCTAGLILSCVIATTTVMWLFIDIREQVSSLRSQIDQVVAGSQGVPDDLQKIHSLSRELQQNQTILAARVTSIGAQLANFSQDLLVVQTSVHQVQERLQSTPEMVNVKDLSSSVAQFGSQIRDLMATVTSLKQQGSSLDAATQALGKNVTSIEVSVGQLLNASLRPAPLGPDVAQMLDNLRQAVSQASANLTEANSTLTKRLQWLQDDQRKDHKLIEGLQDLGQNVTARIKTLEGECAKTDAQNALNITLMRLEDQVNAGAQRLKMVEQSIPRQVITPGQTFSGETRSSAVARPSSVGVPEAALEEALITISSSQPTLLDEGSASTAPATQIASVAHSVPSDQATTVPPAASAVSTTPIAPAVPDAPPGPAG